jgi:acyl carrier protein
MSQTTGTTIDDVKQWILARHENRTDIEPDEDLIETRLVDSLAFVEFVFVIEQASGEEIDMESLDIEDVRTLAAIEKQFLTVT